MDKAEVANELVKLAKELVSQDDELKLPNVGMMSTGRRSREVVEKVFKPIQKEYLKAIKSLKGKWDGHRYFVFKTKENYDKAVVVNEEYSKKIEQLEKDFPEGAVDDAAQIDRYFKQVKDRGF